MSTHLAIPENPTSGTGASTIRVGRVSLRLRRRPALVCLGLATATVVLAVLALSIGASGVTVEQVVGVLLGEQDGLPRSIVLDWRLPRVLAAIVFGAALGVSGAVFQSLTRNPLGSPDVIGFNTGAYTGALITLIVLGGGFARMGLGALLGGLVTALAVYLLSRTGGAAGLRLIIVGIGISAMLAAFNHWLILTAELDTAMAAAVWGAGSLNGLRWPLAGPAVIVLIVLIAATLAVARQLRTLELGDDVASALGLPVDRIRLALLVLGVALTAGATTAAGPIVFVALAAPQLALRLTGGPGLGLVSSAAMGGFLLLASDVIAQHAFTPIQLPVGVVTVTLGGLYLVWLLIGEARR